MNARGLVLVLVLAAGCGRGAATSGTFVRNASIHGNDLVVEKCVVWAKDGALDVPASTCRLDSQRLPTIVIAPPQTLTPEQIAGEIARMRPALAHCLDDETVAGIVWARLVIAASGEVTSVETESKAPELDGCAKRTFASARFPRSQTGARPTFSLELSADE